MQMIAVDGQPFRVVENPGFINLIEKTVQTTVKMTDLDLKSTATKLYFTNSLSAIFVLVVVFSI
uniref:Uncharacterized protein n=1 Tax=Romanomermis culicivorax TaxID=13658 RepID=A0A915HS02_ROMCU